MNDNIRKQRMWELTDHEKIDFSLKDPLSLEGPGKIWLDAEGEGQRFQREGTGKTFVKKEARKTHDPELMRAIQSDPKARKSYKRLGNEGLTNTGLFEELLGMAANRYDHKPNHWYSGNNKDFATFIRQIERVTVQIERLNQDPRFALNRQLFEPPKALRDYSATIQEQNRLLNRKGRPKARAQRFDCLRWLVRNETGKERPADLANILDATTRQSSTFKAGFDFEAALKMRAQRNPFV